MISVMINPVDSMGPATVGAAIRLARYSRGWSQEVLARRIVATRRAYGESVDQAAVKTQLSRWENDRVMPDRHTRQVLAEVFSTTTDALFGLQPAANLPRPILLEAHVTAHTVELLRARRAVHAQTEASFGPAEASVLVSHDVATIDGLLRIVPESLSAELHEVAALIAELGGWIAQDSGDTAGALGCTTRAHMHAQAADNPHLGAMILMRWANVVAASDPRTCVTLSARAESLERTSPPSRLQAAIARQKGAAAAALGDRRTFEREIKRARDFATIPATVGDLAPYADPAYIASEEADALLLLGEAGSAAATLAGHIERWAPGQERDHAVALARWLQALTMSGDVQSALEQTDLVLRAYERAPSVRSRSALQAITRMRPVGDEIHHTALRRRIAVTIDGTRP
ncbi:MAG: helix-turn-helix domain-containing protein [Actinomycetota bacterium]